MEISTQKHVLLTVNKMNEKLYKIILFPLLWTVISSCSLIDKSNYNVSSSRVSFYEAALRYLKGSIDLKAMANRIDERPERDGELSIYVSDSTVFIPYTYFAAELSECGRLGGSSSIACDQIQQIDETRKNEYSVSKINLNSDRRARVSLFLSIPYDNTLAVDVLLDPDKIRNYSKLLNSTTEGIKILFVYDKYGDVVRIYKYGFIYN